MRKFALVLGVCVLAMSFIACSKSNPSNEGGTAAPVAKKAKQKSEEPRYVNISLEQDPEYLDPGLVAGAYGVQVTANVWEGLYSWHPQTAEPVPALAVSHEVSKDQKTYTFKIRTDAKWSDGKPVTAHDFVYAWQRVVNPETASQYAFFLYGFENGKAINQGDITDFSKLGAKAIDDHTLEVRLTAPTPYFLSLLAMPTLYPVPKWAVDAHGPKWTHAGYAVSNGPFKIQEWNPRQDILVVKNDLYWDAANVKLPGVRYFPIEDHDTAHRMYEAGELDVALKLPDMKIPKLAESHPDYVKHPWVATYYYRLNVKDPALQDMRVRQALALSIDRDALVNKFLQGTGLPSASMVPGGLAGYTPATGHEYNPEKAKALLAEAGYADMSTFPELTILYNTQERHKLIAQVVQQMWRQNLGVRTKLFNQEWKSYIASMRQGNYSVARSAWVGDYADPNTFLDYLTTDSTQNFTNWGNAQYDQLLLDAAQETDPAKRLDLLQQAEKIILTEAPVVPVFSYVKHMLVKPYVKGFYGNVQDQHAMKGVTLEF